MTSFNAGATSQTIDVFIPDSSSSTGAGLTGLVYNTSGLTAYYRKGATGTATVLSLATQTVGGAWSSGGFVEIDATNMPGVYRLDLPDAVIDTAGLVHLYLQGAANMAPTLVRIDCRGVVSLSTQAKSDVNAECDTAITDASLGTAAELAKAVDRAGFILSILAGAIADAQTTGESYTITIDGDQFDVDYTGLDEDGNRSGATLTKI